MNPIVYAIPIFMVTIIVEAFIGWRRKKPIYNIPDAVTSLHNGVVSRLSEVFIRAATGGIYIAIWQSYRAFDLPASNPIVWVGALLAYDFCYYWHHRFGHEMNVLWAAHVVHHSSEYFNLSTALRQSSTSALFGWMFFLLLAVIGVPPQVFAVVALIDLLYQYWVHTELIGRMGILDRIMVTPSNHRVHHGQNDYCINKNYGGIFIFWDRILGTFADERADEKIIYGIRKPLQSYSALWTNLHTYVWLWREMMAAEGWRAKLAVWFAPPTGWSGQEIPTLDPATFQRYDPHPAKAVRWYAVGQYAVTTLIVVHFMAIAPQLSWGERGAYALIVLATALSVGALLEGRTNARFIEIARVLALGILFAALPSWFGFVAPVVLKLLAVAIALASAAWLFLRQAPLQEGAPA